MKQLRESVRRLKRGRKEDIVLVRRWFPQFCFHNMRCVRKLAAYASDAKAVVPMMAGRVDSGVVTVSAKV